jgi:hypothetical protein
VATAAGGNGPVAGSWRIAMIMGLVLLGVAVEFGLKELAARDAKLDAHTVALRQMIDSENSNALLLARIAGRLDTIDANGTRRDDELRDYARRLDIDDRDIRVLREEMMARLDAPAARERRPGAAPSSRPVPEYARPWDHAE